jgi:hypothetical protein
MREKEREREGERKSVSLICISKLSLKKICFCQFTSLDIFDDNKFVINFTMKCFSVILGEADA